MISMLSSSSFETLLFLYEEIVDFKFENQVWAYCDFEDISLTWLLERIVEWIILNTFEIQEKHIY